MLSAAWENYGLWGLLASSFLSATILPGNSEVVLVWMLRQAQWPQWQLLAAAVVGNTLGSLCSVWMGRGLAILKPQRGLDTATRWIERYGVWSLWFSWLPLIGDILCLLAVGVIHTVYFVRKNTALSGNHTYFQRGERYFIRIG